MPVREDSRRIRSAFTLVELLVVIAIVGVLVALLLPAVQAARSAARRVRCENNLRQVGIGLHNRHAARSAFPQGRDQHLWSWLADLLPYLEQQSVYDNIDFSRTAWSNGEDQAMTATVIASLLCPADPDGPLVSPYDPYAYTNYLGVSGTDGGVPSVSYQGLGMFPSSGEREDPGPVIALRHVTDGTSRTLFVGERPAIGVDINGNGDLGWWAAGTGWRRSPYGRCDYILDTSEGLRQVGDPEASLVNATHFWSHHPVGVEFLFVDGSVRMLFYDIDHNVFLAQSTRNGDETVRD